MYPSFSKIKIKKGFSEVSTVLREIENFRKAQIKFAFFRI